MIAASYNYKYVSQTGGNWEPTAAGANTDGAAYSAGNFFFKVTDTEWNTSNALVPCGCSTLPAEDAATYTVTSTMTIDRVGNGAHPRQQCILYY